MIDAIIEASPKFDSTANSIIQSQIDHGEHPFPPEVCSMARIQRLGEKGRSERPILPDMMFQNGRHILTNGLFPFDTFGQGHLRLDFHPIGGRADTRQGKAGEQTGDERRRMFVQDRASIRSVFHLVEDAEHDRVHDDLVGHRRADPPEQPQGVSPR